MPAPYGSIYTPYDSRYNNPMFNQQTGAYGATGASTGTGTGAGTNSLGSGSVGGYDPAYGGVPTVPSPQGTQTAAIGGNIGSLASLYNLAPGIGKASAAGAGAALNTNLPGATGALATGLGNTNSLLHGQLPPDVVAQLSQQAAERGVSMGAPGSPAVQTGLLRSLGLTSLGLEQQGLGNLGSLIGMTPTGPAFNPASMLVSPEQQQQAQLQSNILSAAPIPSAAAAANLNALRAAIGQGRNATGPGNTPAPTTGTGTTGSGALGFGFGSLGKPGTLTGTLGAASQAGAAAANGQADPYQDPTEWMNPDEAQQWGAMSPDQQYEEALMGYPSFTGDQTVSAPGQDTAENLGQSVTASDDPEFDPTQFDSFYD